MSGNRLLLTAVAALMVTPFATVFGKPSEVPGWVIAGSAAEKYMAFVDKSLAHDGSASAGFFAQTDANGNEFGTLMQIVNARPHIGQRMRLSAYIRTAGVATGAALWMRVDGVDGEVLAFDNMSRRGLIRGNQSWSRIDVVLDVPPKGNVISFGVILKGEGMVWIDSVSLDPVLKHVTTTGYLVAGKRLPMAPDDLPHIPSNLDFEG